MTVRGRICDILDSDHCADALSPLAIISILGLGMFALPTGILGAGFVEEMQKRRLGACCCPHCGKDTNGPHAQR